MNLSSLVSSEGTPVAAPRKSYLDKWKQNSIDNLLQNSLEDYIIKESKKIKITKEHFFSIAGDYRLSKADFKRFLS